MLFFRAQFLPFHSFWLFFPEHFFRTFYHSFRSFLWSFRFSLISSCVNPPLLHFRAFLVTLLFPTRNCDPAALHLINCCLGLRASFLFLLSPPFTSFPPLMKFYLNGCFPKLSHMRLYTSPPPLAGTPTLSSRLSFFPPFLNQPPSRIICRCLFGFPFPQKKGG